MLPLWALDAFAWRRFPTRWLLRLGQVQGIVASLGFKAPYSGTVKQIREGLGGSLNEVEARAVLRRHLQFLRIRRVINSWPQRVDFPALQGCAVEGLEHLDAALAEGKGAILLTLHLGFGRLAKPILRARNYAVWTLGSPPADLDDEQEQSRFAAFVRGKLLRKPRFQRRQDSDLPVGINLRPVLQALARNEAVLMTVDGKQSLNFVDVPVLGRPVPFATGAPRMATSANAALLPVFVVDTDLSRTVPLKLILKPRIEPPGTGNVDADCLAMLQEFATVAEGIVREHPHLYTWKRFKRRLRSENGAAEHSATYLRRVERRRVQARRRAAP